MMRVRSGGRASDVVIDPLVVVVDGDREHLLGVLLTDHVLVQVFVDLLGRRGRFSGNK